jgi:hypothetical protein
LKSACSAAATPTFTILPLKKPVLAGHSFWYYIGNKYGRKKTTYLLYLARIYRNLNSASNRIAKKKFKEVLRDFMTGRIPQCITKTSAPAATCPRASYGIEEM